MCEFALTIECECACEYACEYTCVSVHWRLSVNVCV